MRVSAIKCGSSAEIQLQYPAKLQSDFLEAGPVRPYQPGQQRVFHMQCERSWLTTAVARYSWGLSMTDVTPETLALRALLNSRRSEFYALLAKCATTNLKLFGSIARGTARKGRGTDLLVEMDPADGNLLMRASGLMEETRILFGRNDIDIFPAQLLKQPISESALNDAVAL